MNPIACLSKQMKLNLIHHLGLPGKYLHTSSGLSWTVGPVRQDRQDRTGPSLCQIGWGTGHGALTRNLKIPFAGADSNSKQIIRRR